MRIGTDIGVKSSARQSHVRLLLAALAALASLLLGATSEDQAASANQPQAATQEPAYDYHFGTNPYLPSQAQASFEGFLKPSDFPSAGYCGKCHADVHKQWRQSAHANSFRAPFYLKNVQLLIDGKGIEFSRHCEGCHNPTALFTGALTKGSKIDRSFDDDGITCSVCHSIQKIQNTSGTGSYVMGRPAVMMNADGTPRYDLPTYDEIFAHPELHKQAVMRDFYKTPEFCAVCHKAAVPKLLNGYKWQRAFSVYDEWQQSSWARQSPIPFYKKDQVSTCQTCHMPAVDATSDYGAKQGRVASHRWLGANTAIPYFYGYDEQLQKVEEYLRAELFGLDFFAISEGPSDDKIIAPLDRQAFTLAPGNVVTLSLVIQNKKIGHTLVPEQRDFYESWVELDVKDAQGRTVYHSGFLKPDGMLDENAHSYTNRLVSKEGQLLDRHQVWQTRVKAYDNTIGPGRSDLVRYRFQIPVRVSGPLTVTAKMNYRRFRRGYTNFILGKSVDYPVVTMASRTMTMNVGENPASAPADPNDYLRWNNYGIALLDQQQYWLAAEAFQHVTELKPDYVDGFVNIGIANYLGERYDAAAEALEKAAKLGPGYPRTLFYQALLDKRAGRLDAAAEKLKLVSAAFPRFRDAYDALGNIYYLQHKLQPAREEYEAVQSIDPDDLSAHNNLMIIYRKLGMKEKAAQQAAYFVDRKNDPSALNYALGFFETHPEMANESVPWHVHAERPLAPPGSKPAPNAATEAQ